MPASAHFVLSFTRAMTEQLSELLASLEPAPLHPKSFREIDRLPGVYELLHREDEVLKVMYVGKADSSLVERLGDHFLKIRARQNIEITDMYFVCAYVEHDLHAVAPESMLIDHRRRAGDAPWNGRLGFGPHDPGRKRDTQDPPPWDRMYPIRIDDPIDIDPGSYALLAYLQQLKSTLPFLFRYQKIDKRRWSGHPEYDDVVVTVPRPWMTARELLALPAAVLPPGWRVTILPGYAILYRDRPRSPVTLAEFDAPG